MCTYNGELFLREQLESLVNQDYPNLEIRIRDDMSSDKTWQIIQDFQGKYTFIHCIQNKNRLGFQKNFEEVFQDCQGIWIAPSDQDDIWSLDKISKLFSKTTDNIMVYHDSVLVDENNKTLDTNMSKIFNFISGQ
nr:glycosyltransferase [Belliella calami]